MPISTVWKYFGFAPLNKSDMMKKNKKRLGIKNVLNHKVVVVSGISSPSFSAVTRRGAPCRRHVTKRWPSTPLMYPAMSRGLGWRFGSASGSAAPCDGKHQDFSFIRLWGLQSYLLLHSVIHIVTLLHIVTDLYVKMRTYTDNFSMAKFSGVGFSLEFKYVESEEIQYPLMNWIKEVLFSSI